MIDIENQVFTVIATSLRSSFPGINVQGIDTYTPSVFPTVSIEEADNSSYPRTRDTGSNDNHAEVMYEVNVYSNLASGQKSQCKAILSVIDNIMNNLGFTRTGSSHAPANQPTTYRIVGRYAAVVGKNEVIYRR